MPNDTCDVFCKVVDNYGDIGVCWRLAKILANEHGLVVRLWVDDLGSFARLCPQADTAKDSQRLRNVEVRHWHAEFSEAQSADLVIETFSCKLPETYIAAMAGQANQPVWINLEHLSAEDWVETHHQLPSPHPKLSLTKYFFFPGFTGKTGGLLRERDLLARLEAFDEATVWQKLGLPPRQQDELRVSLFSYENLALAQLFDTWVNGGLSVCCLLPEGRIQPQVERYFGVSRSGPGDVFEEGNLCVRILPFVEQERYDELLWACDINFVRGEDSFVRAQWAARPFIWHIYPQHDGIHMDKLRAFMAKYCAGLPADAARALQGLWETWNGESGNIAENWNDFIRFGSILRQYASLWVRHLEGNDLAANLLDFYGKIGRMRAFKTEGQ